MGPNLGVVQSSAAAITGLNMPASLEALIEMWQNENNMKQSATETLGALSNSKTDATIAEGEADARNARIGAWSEISGSTVGMVSTTIGFGVGAYNQADVNEFNDQLNNLGNFKKSLINQPDPGGVLPGAKVSAAETAFMKDFNSGSSLEEKGKLFSSKKHAADLEKDPNHYQTSAIGFNPKSLEDVDQLQSFLERNHRAASEITNHSIAMGTAFSQTAQGLIKGSISTQSAQALLEKSQAQVSSNQADFLMQVARSLFDTASSAGQNTQKEIDQLIQNQMTVARSSAGA